MKNNSVPIILNIIIIVLTLFATISMIIGFHFMDNSFEFSATNLAAFKYFTVDSNILAGIASLIYVLYIRSQRKLNSGNQKLVLPPWLSLFKLASTTGVTLTMMVTVCFLAPSSSRGFFALFMNSNLFFHFIIQVLCIISFCFFESSEKIRFPQTLMGIIPMFLYSIYYSLNILLHMQNGQIDFKYDWYGFLGGKLSNIWFVMPTIYIMTWLFSLLLWFGNKKIASRK